VAGGRILPQGAAVRGGFYLIACSWTLSVRQHLDPMLTPTGYWIAFVLLANPPTKPTAPPSHCLALP